ncbi:hypothetical protein [Tolypothrix sp. VBCCA 56010]|uniref:hypothetical protein n=1 Tax=Tolypothrix sp. VBCCA 56010 TaxID=3137731 RepID=UPI003D7D5B57
MGNGHWAMGIKRSFRISMPHAPCPMPHAPCPIPHFSIITIGKTSHQVDEGKNHPTIY